MNSSQESENGAPVTSDLYMESTLDTEGVGTRGDDTDSGSTRLVAKVSRISIVVGCLNVAPPKPFLNDDQFAWTCAPPTFNLDVNPMAVFGTISGGGERGGGSIRDTHQTPRSRL